MRPSTLLPRRACLDRGKPIPPTLRSGAASVRSSSAAGMGLACAAGVLARPAHVPTAGSARSASASGGGVGLGGACSSCMLPAGLGCLRRPTGRETAVLAGQTPAAPGLLRS